MARLHLATLALLAASAAAGVLRISQYTDAAEMPATEEETWAKDLPHLAPRVSCAGNTCCCISVRDDTTQCYEDAAVAQELCLRGFFKRGLYQPHMVLVTEQFQASTIPTTATQQEATRETAPGSSSNTHSHSHHGTGFAEHATSTHNTQKLLPSIDPNSIEVGPGLEMPDTRNADPTSAHNTQKLLPTFNPDSIDFGPGLEMPYTLTADLTSTHNTQKLLPSINPSSIEFGPGLEKPDTLTADASSTKAPRNLQPPFLPAHPTAGKESTHSHRHPAASEILTRPDQHPESSKTGKHSTHSSASTSLEMLSAGAGPEALIGIPWTTVSAASTTPSTAHGTGTASWWSPTGWEPMDGPVPSFTLPIPTFTSVDPLGSEIGEEFLATASTSDDKEYIPFWATQPTTTSAVKRSKTVNEPVISVAGMPFAGLPVGPWPFISSRSSASSSTTRWPVEARAPITAMEGPLAAAASSTYTSTAPFDCNLFTGPLHDDCTSWQAAAGQTPVYGDVPTAAATTTDAAPTEASSSSSMKMPAGVHIEATSVPSSGAAATYSTEFCGGKLQDEQGKCPTWPHIEMMHPTNTGVQVRDEAAPLQTAAVETSSAVEAVVQRAEPTTLATSATRTHHHHAQNHTHTHHSINSDPTPVFLPPSSSISNDPTPVLVRPVIGFDVEPTPTFGFEDTSSSMTKSTAQKSKHTPSPPATLVRTRRSKRVPPPDSADNSTVAKTHGIPLVPRQRPLDAAHGTIPEGSFLVRPSHNTENSTIAKAHGIPHAARQMPLDAAHGTIPEGSFFTYRTNFENDAILVMSASSDVNISAFPQDYRVDINDDKVHLGVIGPTDALGVLAWNTRCAGYGPIVHSNDTNSNTTHALAQRDYPPFPSVPLHECVWEHTRNGTSGRFDCSPYTVEVTPRLWQSVDDCVTACAPCFDHYILRGAQRAVCNARVSFATCKNEYRYENRI